LNPAEMKVAKREAAYAKATFRHRADSTYSIVEHILETSGEARNDRRVLLEMVKQVLGDKYKSPDGIFRRARTIQNTEGRFKPDLVSAMVRKAEQESEHDLAVQTKRECSE
jgi:hypothetical protein